MHLTAGPRPERLPLAPVQRRLWFLSRLHEDAPTYLSPLALRLRGAVQTQVLRAALGDVVARHEALRTVFPHVDGEPLQRILVPFTPPLEVVEDPVTGTEATPRFDLARGPLLQARLVRLGTDEHLLVLWAHHIVIDGWSTRPLVRDLASAYESRIAGAPPRWEPLPVQYADYALWQNALLARTGPDSVTGRQLRYWREVLSGLPEEIALPVDRARPAVPSHAAGRCHFQVDAELHGRLAELARQGRATLFMVLHAALAALLTRLGGGTDVPIGTAVAGRGDEALADLVGFFVNTLVLRSDTSGDPTFRELLARVRKIDLGAYAHHDVPFDRVVEELNPSRTLDRHALFQTMLTLQVDVLPDTTAGDLRVSHHPIDTPTAKFDLAFDFAVRPGGGLAGAVTYARDLFDDETARRLAERLLLVLRAAAADAGTRVGDIDVVLPDEHRELLAAATVRAPAETVTLPAALAVHAAENPDTLAVVDGAHRLTYADLDARVDGLARALAARGVRPGGTVGLALPLSATWIVAALAVHRAGAAYWPLPVPAPEPVAAPPPLTPADRHRIIHEWNDTRHEFPADEPVQTLFEARVAAAPDAPAVRWRGGVMSYRDVDRWANTIAWRLCDAGVGPGRVVAISMRRGPGMVAAILGVLKAGGAYLPVERHLPAGRAAAMVADASASVALVEASGGQLPQTLDQIPVTLDDVDRDPRAASAPDASAGAENTAYVLYTSGTTGRPKGVAVTHRPVRNLLNWCYRTFGFGPGDVGLGVTPLGFDLSVFDVLGLLGCGASLYIADEEQLRDPALLRDVLLREPITFWNSAPTMLNQVARLLPPHADDPGTGTLRLVFLSGDYIPVPLPDEIRAVFRAARIVSLGGPTETTVWSNYYPIGEVDPAWRTIPYGKPIDNCRCYILDEDLEPCPVGVEGDLYVAGACLSAGYVNDPVLTAERFVRDPFATGSDELMYRTGDRASFFPDGTMCFLGRADTQVKIRGLRVELKEIEHRLRQHAGVQDAIVRVRQDAVGEGILAAYVIPATSVAPDAAELRAFAAAELPYYMVPNAVFAVPTFPSTANGKLDHAALPWPPAGTAATSRPDLVLTLGEVAALSTAVPAGPLPSARPDHAAAVLSDPAGDVVVSHAALVARLRAFQECHDLDPTGRLLWKDAGSGEPPEPSLLWPVLAGTTLVLPSTSAGDDGTAHADPVAGYITGPLGRPARGTRAYVLDERLRPVPPGVLGRLYVAGPQLAAGYLHNSALTGERLVPAPYGRPGDRMYRTGRTASWRGGVLDFPLARPAPPPVAMSTRDVAGRTGREAAISTLFAEVLGRPAVGAEESFFELGGHSLLAIRLVERIRAETGVELPVRLVFETPTAAGLADAMERGWHSRTLDVVLPLRTTGDRPPLFCVHPASGISWVYAGLQRHLPTDRPLYGLQARGLSRPDQVATRVDDVAGDLLAEVRRVQPHGPYHLLGWSFGALVAHRLATHLRDAGEQVELLVLVDGYPGTRPATADLAYDDPRLLTALLDSLGYHPHPGRTPLRYADFEAFLTAEPGPLAGLDTPAIRNLARVFAANLAMMGSFRPAAFDGDALLFVATADKSPSGPTPDAWAPYVQGRLEIHEIDCGHGDLARPGPLAEIGAALVERLRTPADAAA
jgi:amino acid adenylation domain-containing protein